MTKIVAILVGVIILLIIMLSIMCSMVQRKREQLDVEKAENVKLGRKCTELENTITMLKDKRKKKQEINNETKQNLANIANGSTADSIAMLQKPRKERTKNK